MFTGVIGISAHEIREQSSTQLMALGSKAETRDGRKFRYAKAGGTALTVGTMNEQAAIVANHVNKVVSVAVAVGGTVVAPTIGATAATKDYYAEGYLLVNDAAGEGILYSVAGHPANAGSLAMPVTLNEPVAVALTTSSEVTLMVNKYKGVIIVPQAATSGGAPVGVANVAITEAYYGWLQTSGPCAMLSASTPQTLGEEVSQSNNEVAGAAGIKMAAAPTYGVAMQLGVATEYQVVDLNLE